MKKYALLVAGGVGRRMKSPTPKQFLIIGTKPVIIHTIEAFLGYDSGIEIILVLPQDHVGEWQRLAETYHLSESVKTCVGGGTRFQSVQAGLELVAPDSLVAIHDGVRPLIARKVIEEGYTVARKKGSAIASVPLRESIRKVGEQGSEALDRSQYRLIQTPQTFTSDLIKKAYSQRELAVFTDCASVAEYTGHEVTLIDSDYTNLKITGPEDIPLAEALLAMK
ncbi:2-C-methyl-D-erythritol 4-phosphate cytidylyltransferase [Roseivirga sp. BDSF3-8]|uniref:2-C-methyl-D-erythritol 4-phosphate cytidylyltransferase n=1 Tax=Roseivirga sp. BDSF3-8 TaxID=3241598 RepID=UPI003531B976